MSTAKYTIAKLNPDEVGVDDVKYLEDLFEQLTKFFKNRFKDQWRFDAWRSRYYE